VLEAATPARCHNNLKQIGLALHNFHTDRGSFPPGYQDQAVWPDPDQGPGWGWASLLLDYLEQGAIRSQINYSLYVGDPFNAPPRILPLKVLLCPSDRQVGTFTVTDGGTNSWVLAQGSYVACNGNDGVDDMTTPPHTGVFVRGPGGFRIEDITDGTSNT